MLGRGVDANLAGGKVHVGLEVLDQLLVVALDALDEDDGARVARLELAVDGQLHRRRAADDVAPGELLLGRLGGRRRGRAGKGPGRLALGGGAGGGGGIGGRGVGAALRRLLLLLEEAP